VLEDVAPRDLADGAANHEVPPFVGSMVKNEQDLERLAHYFGLRKRRR
jgi:hypothetical protein